MLTRTCSWINAGPKSAGETGPRTVLIWWLVSAAERPSRMVPSAVAATLNKSRRFIIRRQPPSEPLRQQLVLALTHAAGCRLKGTRLKSRHDLFGAAGGLDQNHRYSTRLERCNRALTDAATQY